MWVRNARRSADRPARRRDDGDPPRPVPRRRRPAAGRCPGPPCARAAGRRAGSRRRRSTSSPAATIRDSAVRIVPGGDAEQLGRGDERPHRQHRRVEAEEHRQHQRSGVERADRLATDAAMLHSVDRDDQRSCMIDGDDAHARRAATMVPPDELLPDVLPTDRLNVRAMPVRPLRDELRRIPTVRNAITVVMALVQTFGVVIAAAVVDTWWAWVAGVPADGPRPLPAQHPRPRGRPPPAVPEPPGQRLRRPLAARLPDVPGVHRLPPRPLRPPPRRARPRRARPRAVPRLPDPGRLVAPQAAPRPPRRERLQELQGASWRSAPQAAASRRCQILAVQVVLLGASIAVRRPLAYVVWIGSWSHAVEVLQPAAGDRRARRHGALGRPPPHDPRHPPDARWPASAWCRTTPAGTSPTTSTWACRGATCPALHDELVRSGWLVPDVEYPTYRAFWRACSSGRRAKPTPETRFPRPPAPPTVVPMILS